MKQNHFKNEYVEMWLENGIIHVVHSPYVTINLEIAKLNVAARLEIAEGKTYPLFADVTKAKTMTKEARQYLSAGDGIRGISAGAFLIKTQIEAFLVNSWLRIYPMSLPTKMFSEKEAALAWLETFKRIN